MGALAGGLAGGISASAATGLMVNQMQQDQTNNLSTMLQIQEGKKTRENMLREAMKKLNEMEQNTRMSEMKSTREIGEKWGQALG